VVTLGGSALVPTRSPRASIAETCEKRRCWFRRSKEGACSLSPVSLPSESNVPSERIERWPEGIEEWNRHGRQPATGSPLSFLLTSASSSNRTLGDVIKTDAVGAPRGAAAREPGLGCGGDATGPGVPGLPRGDHARRCKRDAIGSKATTVVVKSNEME